MHASQTIRPENRRRGGTDWPAALLAGATWPTQGLRSEAFAEDLPVDPVVELTRDVVPAPRWAHRWVPTTWGAQGLGGAVPA